MSENEKSALDLLKEEATRLGISFSERIGEATLQERINEFKAPKGNVKDPDESVTEGTTLGDPEPVTTETVVTPVQEVVKPKEKTIPPAQPKPAAKPVVQKSEHQKEMEKNKQMRNDANRLVRVNIVCMNPNKRHMKGDIFTVGNKIIGTVRKMVPFNTTEGFHVPQALLSVIEDKKCQIFVDHVLPGPGNLKTKKGKMISEYAIQYLDKLNKDELKELAKRQALAGAIDSEEV